MASEETPIACPTCGDGRFFIVDGQGLPWSARIKCVACRHVMAGQSEAPETWIMFIDVGESAGH